MKRYDLSEACKRLDIQGLQNRILYYKVSNNLFFGEEFASGTPLIQYFSSKYDYLVISTGDQCLTDKTLAHEVLGHGVIKQRGFVNFLREFNPNHLGVSESNATYKALEKMIELEKRFPEKGYGELVDKILVKVERIKKRDTLNPLALFYYFMVLDFYVKNLDVDKLKLMRERVV